MAITVDHSIFFDSTYGMAKQVTYTRQAFAHVSANSQTLDAFFDNVYVDAMGTVISTTPVLAVRTDQLPDARSGDHVRVDGVDYEIKGGPQPDGHGVTRYEMVIPNG